MIFERFLRSIFQVPDSQKAFWFVKRGVLRWQTHRAAMANTPCCDGKHTVLRFYVPPGVSFSSSFRGMGSCFLKMKSSRRRSAFLRKTMPPPILVTSPSRSDS